MQVIETYGLSPERFKLEITESMLIEHGRNHYADALPA